MEHSADGNDRPPSEDAAPAEAADPTDRTDAVNPAGPADLADLADLVQQWLPTQRFFAGKQRPIQALELQLLGRIGAPDAEIQLWLADVRYVDGVPELYQVPLHLTTAEYETQAHARLGDVSGSDGTRLNVYDALAGKHLTQAFLQGIVDESVVGALRFSRVAPEADIPLGTTSYVLGAEQSNTSAVFGDKAILKVFRRLEVGINPDIEITEALSRGSDAPIARLLGFITAELGGVEPSKGGASGGSDSGGSDSGGPDSGSGARQGEASLAMLQEFMSNATDGWELAKGSVRDLMAEGDLHAEEAGGDFASESYRLGRATAEVHAELVAAFGTEQLDAQDMRARADAMVQRLNDALSVVPQLAEVADALRKCYEDFATTAPMTVQRVHGDLHLGQVLRTVDRWVVLDFEGEPAKSIADRREADSPLRDVAGMIRSFDYAANHQAIDTAIDSQQHYRAVEWAERNQDAFCAGYASVGPDPREQPTLLHAFEADKAVYEAMYEARNRPAWLPVPLSSLDRLASRSDIPTSAPPPLPADESADREDSR